MRPDGQAIRNGGPLVQLLAKAAGGGKRDERARLEKVVNASIGAVIRPLNHELEIAEQTRMILPIELLSPLGPLERPIRSELNTEGSTRCPLRTRSAARVVG